MTKSFLTSFEEFCDIAWTRVGRHGIPWTGAENLEYHIHGWAGAFERGVGSRKDFAPRA